MEEDVHFDIIFNEYHDKTITTIKKYLSDKINLEIRGCNAIINIYDQQIKKGIFFKKKVSVKLAKIRIAISPDYYNTIVVTEEGKPYYKLFKKIGDELGYDKILRKWG